MIERYVDIDFDNRISYEAEGGFDNEHDATIIRLKVIDENAKYYLDLGMFSGGFSKYRTEALPIENGYATYRLPRDLTHGHLHVQGVMKIGDICRKTATITMRLGGSINALDELPESHPGWADSVDEQLEGASNMDILTILAERDIITPMQQSGVFFMDGNGSLLTI